MRRRSKRPTDPLEAAALAEVRSIYADLAARPVTRACTLRTECCHFKLTGRTPLLTTGEARLAAKALRATGRRALPDRTDGACPLLDEKTARCLIYDGRPFGCRTHYCAAAGGPTARRDVLDLIRRLEAVDESLGGDGPHPIGSAVTRALER
ncbi:MAG: YkgJ family cysteine cluster protein [Chthoniobacterales bacterium]